MYISARERKIIEFLVLKSEETTVKDLSKQLEVSARTIHRDLKGVEQILKQFGLCLNKKAGTGLKIVGDNEKKEKLQLFLFNIPHNEYTPEERQTVILSTLIDSVEPVKLVSLANELNVTIATISNDLNKVEEQIEPYGLSLVRKRGYGVELIGEESAKRNLMSTLILNNLDEFEFMSIIKENIKKKSTPTTDTLTNRLLGHVDKNKLLIIEKQINKVKKELPYSIADSSYIGLVIHLALTIERIQQGEAINFDESVMENLNNTKEFEVAKKIVNGLEEVFQINISNGEIGYITMHLIGAKLRKDQGEFLDDQSMQIGILVQNLIHFVSQKINADLTTNLSLFQGLVSHLRPALYRIKLGMGISNPLLSNIQKDYQDLFLILEKGVLEILPEIKIPKEEIGYLVMHFASAILNQNISNEINALVVCSSGIGTSKILSTRLEHEIPGLKTRNVSLFELDSIDNYDYDVIVSTIPLKNFSKEYILVSPLLTKQEVDKVREFLVHHGAMNRNVVKDNSVKDTITDRNQFLEQIEKTMLYSTPIFQIIKGFSITHIYKIESLDQVLELAVENLLNKGVIDNKDEVKKSLLQREKLGGLGIPNTSLALYHTKSNHIKTPSFTMYRLIRPIRVKAMDGSEIEMGTMLLMLSPFIVNDETIEVLSAISSLLIRDEESITKFQEAHESELHQFLTTELKNFFELKTSLE